MKRTFLTMTLMAAALAMPALAQNAQNLRIVSIGDSFASGEGNPNGTAANGAAVWSNTPCHRSIHNGRRFAANRINDLPNTSVDFSDFACTGATINNGLLGAMSSAAPETPNAQIDGR